MTMLDPPPRSPIPVEQRIARLAVKYHGVFPCVERTCQVCGVVFLAGKTAKYCMDCRRQRDAESTTRYKRRAENVNPTPRR